MVGHEILVVARVSFAVMIKHNEYDSGVLPSYPALGLNVLSSARWHALEDHKVQSINVHSMRNHTGCRNQIKHRLRLGILNRLKNSPDICKRAFPRQRFAIDFSEPQLP